MVRFEQQPAGFLYLDSWYGDVEKPHSCEAHILFARQYWGNPNIEKSCYLLMTYLFKKLKLYRIECWASSKNIPAVKLLRRLGFIQEGRARGRIRVNDRPQTEYLFAMIRPDYFQQSS